MDKKEKSKTGELHGERVLLKRKRSVGKAAESDRTLSKKNEAAARAITVLMVIALWLLAAMNGGTAEAEESAMSATKYGYASENEYPNIVRFHVIANSDGERDQELKLGVRDYVLPKIEDELLNLLEANENSKASDSERAKLMHKYISENLSRIQLWAEEYVRSQGFDYEIKTELGVRAIPAKQYDDLYFPAGNYEALTISIGEGSGQNWWCVVFPPLCLIDGGGAEDSDKGDEVLGKNAESRIILKSKIKTLLQQRTEKTAKA